MVSGEWWVRIERYEESPTHTDFHPPENPRARCGHAGIMFWCGRREDRDGWSEASLDSFVRDALREDAGQYDRDDVVAFVRALRECRRRLEGNVQARIALDALLMRSPRAPVVMRSEK